MGAPKKSAAKASSSDDPEEVARVPLQATLLADSFTTKFRPITSDLPNVLLPLVNVPMIEGTLWLAGVEEFFVFCCAHAKQVASYIENSQWRSHPNFTFTMIEWHHSISARDALRLIYERNVIEMILKFEEICLESARELSPLFTQILHFLFDKDILSEEAIQDWETEKANADDSDKIFVKQAAKFLQWL